LLLGRLQTRQDRARVLDGLATAGVRVGDLDDALAELAPRRFVVRDGGPPRTLRSRHTLGFLRGPVDRAEVFRLGAWAGGQGVATDDGLIAAPSPCREGLPARKREGKALRGRRVSLTLREVSEQRAGSDRDGDRRAS
jgi:hypothetical protein